MKGLLKKMSVFQNPIEPPHIVKGWIDNKQNNGSGIEIPPSFIQVPENKFLY